MTSTARERGTKSPRREVRQGTEYPCSPSQEVFWALQRLEPSSSVGNEAIALRIRGPLRVAALVRSIEIVAEGYEPWHSRIAVDPLARDGCPRVVVRRQDPFPVERLSLRPQAVTEFIDGRVREPFDLAAEAPVRVALARLGEADHLLLVVAHHVAFDGYSLFRMWPEDLSRCYSALLRGTSPPARGEDGYELFAREQRARALAEDRPTLAFWRRALAGAELGIDLSTRQQRSTLSTPRARKGRRLQLRVGAAERADLEAGARKLGCSLSDLLLSAFAVALERHANQSDLVIGVPNANRLDPRFAGVFGCLMVTAPVRLLLSDDLMATELVASVRDAKRSAFQNLDPGLSALTPSSVLFNFTGFSHRDARLEGLEVEAERPDPGWASADLSLDVVVESSGLTLTLEYDTDLFAPALAGGLLQRIQRVAWQLQEDPAARVGAIDVLSDEDRRALIALGSGAALPSPTSETVADLITSVASAEPDASALACRDRQVTYRDLEAAASHVAARLGSHVSAAGDRVAVIVEDPVLCVISFLGVLRAGGAYVPIDPALPAARRGWMLEASEPCAVLTDFEGLDLPDSEAPILVVDAAPPARRATSSRHAPAVSAADAAYVIFTSGSTGRPKGVVITHGNLLHQLAARLAAYPNPPERLLTTHSFAFDAAIAGLYWALATGGLLVLPDQGERSDPVALRRLVRNHGIRTIDITPGLYAELLAGDASPELQTLEAVIVGGEECSPALVRAHRAQLPKARLWNEYGPTEATVFATVAEISQLDDGEAVPIGRPIANGRCYVLDSRQRLAPPGVAGELHLGGPGISPGYIRDAALSAECFASDPFSSESGARVFRTGDLVRWSPDGQLFFLGRMDRQIKLRGYRVELAEIDRALGKIPGVKRAVSVARSGPTGTYVDAYVVLASGSDVTARSLRQALRESLPDFMIPRHIEPIPELPLAPSGKIELAALPTPSRVLRPETGRPRDPRTQTEQRLVDLWQELLELEGVAISDDFFDLGGQSLVAVRMLARVRSTLGIEIPLARFARHPTIQHLADLLHAEGPLGEEPLVVPLRPQGSRSPLWLIHAVGGHVIFGRRLLPYLDADQPVFGIQAQGLDGHRAPLRSIEAMSDLYTKLIVQRQPSGPYLLSGNSLGGLIAREIGARLRASGQQVRLVALFDTPGPDYPRRALPFCAGRRLRKLAKAQWRAAREWAVRRGLGSDPECARGSIPDRSVDRVVEALEAAADRFVPTFQRGTVHVFRALRTERMLGTRFDDPACGWAKLHDRVETIPIDCTHEEMFDEPHVARVGSSLDALLTKLAKTGHLLLVLLAIALQLEPPCDVT